LNLIASISARRPASPGDFSAFQHFSFLLCKPRLRC
jgi:hypothetical protein